MLFNSLIFFVFLLIVFACYWFIFNKHVRLQNLFVLFASYLFYGWWDYRFLGLIAASTLVDFFVGKSLFKEERKFQRRWLLILSLVFNLGVLGFFKYYNFFVTEGIAFIKMLGFNAHAKTIQIILPVGISFYTFQTLSYTIDIYRRQLRPTNDLVAFGAFVSFFPQLVAGPIERASHLLPQMLSPRAFNFESARTGLGLIIWGLFKKVVIADSFAPLVDSIFGDIQGASAITLFFGALMFAFQIYGDFSGYSDMAIGIAALFGFKLMTNFNKPYLALNIQDFWRRWHISLTTWFKDYLYIPLGGSRVNKTKVFRNVFIVFLVSGFWHGANFTFIAWGFLHFLFYLPSLLRSNSKMNSESGLRKTFMAAKTFILVVLAWVFFRASSISEAFDYLKGILVLKDGYSFIQTNTHLVLLTKGFIGVSIMYCYEYFTLKSRRLYNFIHFFVFIFLLIFLGSFKNPISFIYFQF